MEAFYARDLDWASSQQAEGRGLVEVGGIRRSMEGLGGILNSRFSEDAPEYLTCCSCAGGTDTAVGLDLEAFICPSEAASSIQLAETPQTSMTSPAL